MKLLKPLFLAIAALLAVALPEAALAQTVTVQPQFISPNAVTDLGNGPMEIKVGVGTAMIGSSVGTGVGSTSGSSTTLTLTATPAIAPCVGCIISGTGITSGTTVAAFNGTTTITLSAAMTVAASTPLSWGAACPATALTGIGVMQMSAGSTQGATDFPFYTQARICGYGQSSAGAQIFTFPIGAH
jgi:hypothetical protein